MAKEKPVRADLENLDHHHQDSGLFSQLPFAGNSSIVREYPVLAYLGPNGYPVELTGAKFAKAENQGIVFADVEGLPAGTGARIEAVVTEGSHQGSLVVRLSDFGDAVLLVPGDKCQTETELQLGNPQDSFMLGMQSGTQA